MHEERKPDDARSAPLTEDVDVEAHGAKEVMSVGLAAAAFLGTGASANAYEGAAAGQQEVAYVTTENEAKAIDGDGDGYVSFDELAAAGLKYDVENLNGPGYDVGVEDLAAAAYKVRVDLLGEGGFATKVDTIMLKRGIDVDLDAIVDRWGRDWPSKFREIDADRDGYASVKELAGEGYKLGVRDLVAEGDEVTVEKLAAVGYKVNLDVLGAAGFTTELDTIMLKRGIDNNLDAILDGKTPEWPSKI